MGVEAVLLEKSESKPCEPRLQEGLDASSCWADDGQYTSNIEKKRTKRFYIFKGSVGAEEDSQDKEDRGDRGDIDLF